MTLPATITVPFGVKTRASYGGYPVSLTSGGTLTLTGTAATYFTITTVTDENSVSWSMIVPNSVSRAALAGTTTSGTLTLGPDTCALTIDHQANAWDVRPNSPTNTIETASSAQLKSTWQDSSLALGDVIWLRDGSYNLSMADMRIRRAAVPTGIWTGSNWVTVKGRTFPATAMYSTAGNFGATIRRLTIEGFSVKEQYVSVEGVHFYRPNPGGQASGAVVLGANATLPIAFQRFFRCRFSSDESSASTSGGTTATRHAGITSQPNAQDMFVEESYFVGVYDGCMLAGSNGGGSEARMTVRGNVFQDVWNDCIKITSGHPVYVRDNVAFNKRYGTGGLHGDFLQLLNADTAAGSYAFGEVSGNAFVRGDGTSGQGDGQGIFHTCSSPNRGGVGGPSIRYTSAIIRNNLIQNTFARAISIMQVDGALIERNTVFKDTTSIAPTVPGTPGIFIGDGGSGGNAATVRRNVVAATGVSNDVLSASGGSTTSSMVTTPALNIFSATGAEVAGFAAGASVSSLLAKIPTLGALKAAYVGVAGALLSDDTFAGRFVPAENVA